MPSNAAHTFAYLQAQGLPPGAAAGVDGNLLAESSDNPDGPAGDGGTSHGIAQWHNERWTALLAWARGLGKDPTALDTQEAYLVHEAQGMGNLWGQLKVTTDPSVAAALWQREFERPANPDPRARQQLARQVLAAGGDVPSSTSPGGHGGGGLDTTSATYSTGGGASGNDVSLTDPSSWVQGIVDGFKSIALVGLAGAFGLALLGVGIVKVTGTGPQLKQAAGAAGKAAAL